MDKKHFIGIIILVAIIVVIALLKPKNIAQAPSQQIDQTQSHQPQQQVACTGIEITSPTPHSHVTFPLTVTGTMRPTGQNAGHWIVFEANGGSVTVTDTHMVSFSNPVPLAVVGQEWMNSNPLSFSVTIPSLTGTPPNNTAQLVFMDDNPSGEPQNQHTCIIPIQL